MGGLGYTGKAKLYNIRRNFSLYNFTYDIGTVVHFGKGQIEKLPEAVLQYGKKALLCYGGGSIKKNGIYDAVTQGFSQAGIQWVELSGIDPNPRVTSVAEGAKLCRDNDVEVVVAVGGGSTIDWRQSHRLRDLLPGRPLGSHYPESAHYQGIAGAVGADPVCYRFRNGLRRGDQQS